MGRLSAMGLPDRTELAEEIEELLRRDVVAEVLDE